MWLVVRGVQGKNATAWAGRQRYAEVSGKDPAQVSRSTKRLVAMGWLEAVGKRGRDTEYRCHAPGGSVTESHLKDDGESFEIVAPMTLSHSENDAQSSADDAQSFSPTPPYKEESVQEPVKESVQPPVVPQGTADGDKPKRVRRKKPKPEAPDWIDPALWSDWEAHRREIGKALKPTTTKHQINQLNKLRTDGQDPDACIRQSLANGWTGIFAVKHERSGTNGRGGRPPRGGRTLPSASPAPGQPEGTDLDALVQR